MISKRKIIYFLVAVVAALLFINVMLGVVEKKESTKELSLNKNQIEERFIDVLNEYGIKENWTEKRKINKGKYDSLEYKYKLNIPSEISIPVLLKDVNKNFSNTPVVMSSSEKKFNGLTVLNIESGGFSKLMVEIRYDLELAREYSKIGFLIDDLEDRSVEEVRKLFDLALSVGVLLPLEKKSIELAELIKKNKLNYFVELSDDTDNLDYELNEELGLEKLNINITKIISSFNSPKVFFINELESGFNASITGFISEKFEKRGRKVLTSNNYSYLKGEDNDDLHSLVQFQLNKLKPGTSKIFRISLKDFYNVQIDLQRYLKKGNKIVLPSSLFNY